MLSIKKLCAGIGIGLASCGAARAAVIFNGFGQIIVGTTLDNSRPMNVRTPAYAYSADPSFLSESLFALQTTATLSDTLSAVAQIVASGVPGEKDTSGSVTPGNFQPEFSWAYLHGELDNQWSVNLGRQRLPLYRYSGYLQVGVAYPWIRPPSSVYSTPINNFDGVLLNGDFSPGDWFLHPQFFYGGFNGNALISATPVSIKLNNLGGAVIEATYANWLTLRAEFGGGQLTFHTALPDQIIDDCLNATACATLPAPYNTLNIFTPLPAAADVLRSDNKWITYTSAAFELNRYNFVLIGEINEQRIIGGSYLANYRNYYIGAGYQFGRLLPMLTYSRGRAKNSDPNSLNIVTADITAGNPFGASDPRILVVQGLFAQISTIDDYYEFSLRYDLTATVALKLDYTYYASPADPAIFTAQGFQHAQIVSGGVAFSF